MSVKLMEWGIAPYPIPNLADLTAILESTVFTPTTNRPIVSIRFLTNGDIEEAIGDTDSALVYVKVGTWVQLGVDSSDWELQATIDTEDVGAAGTWTASSTGVFIDLSIQRTFSWTKDSTALGSAESTLTIILRQISNLPNTTTRAGLTYRSIVSV